jgi:predicted RND superfamily exporter protein
VIVDLTLGWELGFLESVCFAILVGVSADFVIHISNSYCQLPGERSRKDRTQYALMNMGPSVIGSAITTCLVAFMMLFCEVVFFVKFAQMLLVTIMFSFVGSFGVFIVIADIMGPVEPSKSAEKMLSFLCRLFKR